MSKTDNNGKQQGRYEMAIRLVINDIMNGAPASVLKQKLMENQYGLDHWYSQPRASYIITQARKRIIEDTKEMMPTLREDMLNRTLDVYSECREVGDRLGAIKALDSINKMFGLYETVHTIKGELQSSITISFGIEDEKEDEEEVDNGIEVQN